MGRTSISTKGRYARDRLPEGKMTWKRMMGPAGENSPPINKLDTLIECKDSLDWLNVSFSVNMIFLNVRDKMYTQMCLFISSTL